MAHPLSHAPQVSSVQAHQAYVLAYMPYLPAGTAPTRTRCANQDCDAQALALCALKWYGPALLARLLRFIVLRVYGAWDLLVLADARSHAGRASRAIIRITSALTTCFALT